MAVGAIIKSRSVNLTRMATVMDSDAKIDSRIRRLKRFICQTQICKAALARFILKTGEPLNLVWTGRIYTLTLAPASPRLPGF